MTSIEVTPIEVTRHRTVQRHQTPARSASVHGDATLVFYTGGHARVELDGEWRVREGDALLVPAGSRHRMLEASQPELWKLSFSVPGLARGDTARLLEPFEKVRDGGSAVVNIARGPYFEGLLRELADTKDDSLVQQSLLTLILAEVSRTSSRLAPAPARPSGVVARALRFIERRCLGPLTLKEVAAAVERSPAYVTTALTKATGRSAGQWIVSGRMAEARRLLLHSTTAVEAIASRVGYADATHFIRMFRREHGVTPAAWRAQRCASTTY